MDVSSRFGLTSVSPFGMNFPNSSNNQQIPPASTLPSTSSVTPSTFPCSNNFLYSANSKPFDWPSFNPQVPQPSQMMWAPPVLTQPINFNLHATQPSTTCNVQQSQSATPQPPLMTFGKQQFYLSPSTATTAASKKIDKNVPIHHKRKSEVNTNAPVKQYITEEKMADHMSRLHISSETPLNESSNKSYEEPADREKRLIMCEEMRRLQTESVIPQALLKRLERPCMAVMLWQPPERALFPNSTSSPLITHPSASRYDLSLNNNNNNGLIENFNTSNKTTTENSSSGASSDCEDVAVDDVEMDV